MAFCNSCGAPLTAGSKFCNKCGSTIAAGPIPATPQPAAPPASGGSGVKTILIVIGVLVVFGMLAVAGLGFVAYHASRNARVRQDGNNVKVELPFGTVETSQDPQMVAQRLGIDVYPGAQAQKDAAASASFGSIHTVTAVFQTSDSLDKVCTFYKTKLPAAAVTTSDQNHCAIVSNDQKNMITISIEPSGEMTKFSITSVNKKSD